MMFSFCTPCAVLIRHQSLNDSHRGRLSAPEHQRPSRRWASNRRSTRTRRHTPNAAPTSAPDIRAPSRAVPEMPKTSTRASATTNTVAASRAAVTRAKTISTDIASFSHRDSRPISILASLVSRPTTSALTRTSLAMEDAPNEMTSTKPRGRFSGWCRRHRRGFRGGLRHGDREVLAAIVFVATSGCTWQQLPAASFGPSGATAHRRFSEWSKARVWAKLHRVVLDELGSRGELDWSRCAIDSVNMRALRRGT